MLLSIEGIGNQKIKYKNNKNIEFDTLNSYIILAKKAISKFGNGVYSGLSIKMLNDEDAISSVAHALMMADWRWDENYKNEQGTKKSKYSYRNQCAIWAIQTYASKQYKKPKKLKKVFSLDHVIDNDSGIDVHSYIQDNKINDPLDILEKKQEDDIKKELIQDLLSSNLLTDKQKNYIRLYYFESYTFEKIGKKYGITREAVRQGLNKALSIIRNIIKE